MGLGTLPKTKKKLLQDGVLGKRTPCLAVENGTTLKERRVFSTLEFIDVAVVDAQLQSPTLLFIGDAVRLSPYFPEALSKESFSSSSSSMMRWELQVGQDEDEDQTVTLLNSASMSNCLTSTTAPRERIKTS